MARHTWWFVKHFGGMGNADKDLPSDIWPLDLDNEDITYPMRSVVEALEFLKEF